VVGGGAVVGGDVVGGFVDGVVGDGEWSSPWTARAMTAAPSRISTAIITPSRTLWLLDSFFGLHRRQSFARRRPTTTD
jgi:hypothetical protein